MRVENAIKVHDIRKSLRVYLNKGGILKELVLLGKRRKYEERQVFQGTSFEVEKGETLDLIGHNSCGKSATLKPSTRIVHSGSGTIEARGRVSDLIELGAGLHSDMSGRQNIYTSAFISGLTRKEVDARVNSITEFSELGAFIDNPVRTYSSGMRMYLVFVVTTNANTDVLLVGEILTVGDTNFQVECFSELREVEADGTTTAIVLHSSGQIGETCERSIQICEGRIQKEGKPREIHPAYLRYMGQKRPEAAAARKEKGGSEHPGDGRARIKAVEVTSGKGGESNVSRIGGSATLSISHRVMEGVKEAFIGFKIYNGDGVRCYSTDARMEKMDYTRLERDREIYLVFENLGLLDGRYIMDFPIRGKNSFSINSYAKVFSFEMYSDVEDTGTSRPAHKRKVRDA